MNTSAQTDFASKAIALGRTNLATDPRTGVFQIYSGQLLLARHALTSSDAKFFEAIRQAANTIRTGFSDYHVVPTPERQNNGIIFAAAASDMRGATELATIEPDYSDSHRFDIALSRALRSALCHSEVPSSDYNPTTAEAGLFETLSAVGTAAFSIAGADRYWRATRRKRYKDTIHEYRNLISEALQKLHESSQKWGG